MVQFAMPPHAASAAPILTTRQRNAPSTAALPLVRLQIFTGPLDLLLHLVRAGKMDIFDLPIAELCDQFVITIRAWESCDLSVAGEFLVMAATLIEIKSRMLLPAPPKEVVEESDETDADPRAALVRQLLEYGRYQTASDFLRDSEILRRDLFFRDRLAISDKSDEAFVLPPVRFGEQSAADLWRTLNRLLATVGADEKAAVTAVRRQKLTLRITMRIVLQTAVKAASDGLPFDDLLPPAPYALFELVLLFLALLELMKTGHIAVIQEGFGGGIRLYALPDAEQAIAK